MVDIFLAWKGMNQLFSILNEKEIEIKGRWMDLNEKKSWTHQQLKEKNLW